MSTLKELREQNTLDKWPDRKEANYVAVDEYFTVTYFSKKPQLGHRSGCFYGYSVELGKIDSSIARLSMQIAIDYGVENSLLEKPKGKISIWKPKDNELYYYPCVYPETYIKDAMCNKWVGYEIDQEIYSEGCAFPKRKYARWVVQEGKDPFILQAALAVGGLASGENIFYGSASYDVGYISNYYNLMEQKWEAFPSRMGSRYEPHRVYFKSPEKAEEALKVVLPTGETLYDYLKGK